MFGVGVGVRVGGFTASSGATAIVATGGTITYSGGRTIHTFTSSGTFTVTSAPSGATVEALVIAGGGGGGMYAGGGGGAGGALYDAAKSISATAYTITIGSGGSPSPNNSTAGTSGNNSVFDTLTAVGGGRGGYQFGNPQNGGSGGGMGYDTTTQATGTAGQGNNGGTWSGSAGGAGGGGKGAVGSNGLPSEFAGNGGIGQQYSVNGTLTYYAGGGAGGGNGGGAGLGIGGLGGGGNSGVAGAANTGGGGGGGYVTAGQAKAGGSGIVIISYPT